VSRASLPAGAGTDGPTAATDGPPEDRPPAEPAAEPKRGRLARIVGWSLGSVVALALIATGLVVWSVWRAFPQYDGEITLPSLSAPVKVYRDDHAIPQLYAQNAEDLFTAQGYVAAQERFFEMDFRRHVTSGRLAEMFGSGQVDTDSYLRTMGWRRVAEQEWNIITPESRQYLTDYANGVNAYLKGKSNGQVSLEYSVLGLQTSYTIAPWDPIDSLAWLKALAYDLRGNMDAEIDRATLLGSGLTRAQVESLYPAYPFDQHQPIVTAGGVRDGVFTGTATPAAPGGDVPGTAGAAGTVPAVPAAALPALAAVKTAIDGVPGLVGENFPGIGSNSWVISGGLTTTGKPILANDPHLAPSMPGIWYQMGLHCACAFNVEGFTFSGVPGVVIGHNARIAWGFTNLDPDVTDLYLEKIKGNRYEVDGVWRDLGIRTETIKVAGGKPVTLRVRTTDNGPLLSDVSDDLHGIAGKPPVDPSGSPVAAGSGGAPEPGVTYGVALRWTALDPGRTMDALFDVDAAGNWSDFRAAAAKFEVPSQNMIYADVDGNIGYQSPGRIPVRTRGDGRWPAPGWDSSYDWKGFLPFAELPNELNPAQGFIATANQAVIDPAGYQPFLTDDWSYGYRSQRIVDMLTAATSGGGKISVSDVQRMQFDNRNGFAAQIAPRLLAEHLTGDAAKAQALLDGWDFQQPADGDRGTAQARSSAAAAYFNAVWHNLVNLTFDELPADQRPDGEDRWFVVVDQLLDDPTNAWWDEKGTPAVETRDDVVTQAMVAAGKELAGAQGADPAGWRWGRMHTLYVQNASLGKSGIAPIEWLFNYGPAGVSGGSAIVNATGSDISHGYDVDAVPSMRMIVDMSNLDASRWIQLTGESGHAFSAHYHDQFDLWRTGQTLPMRWDESSIRAAARDTLTLTP
jgi:penicillin amidase